MATVTLKDEFEGSRILIRRISISGADAVAESVIVEAAELAPAPNGISLFGHWKLMEAAWDINDAYDVVKLYYEDEANDLEILTMHPGSGSQDFSGWGGATVSEVCDEGNAATDEDWEVKMDVTENGDENTGGSAFIELVFKKKDFPQTVTLA